MILPVRRTRLLGALLAVALAAPAQAQFWQKKGDDLGAPPDVVPVALEEVRVDEQLGAQLPLDAPLRDHEGRPVTLGSLLGDGKPLVLTLVYYDCPMLCGLIQSGLARAMRENGLVAGKDFRAVSVSFDPEEQPPLARERRRGYLQSMGLSEASDAWSFWVDQAGSARRIADAVGFHYAKDPATGEWAHLAATFVLSPDGRVSRYLYGIEFPPKDFRLSLVEAAGGRVGTSFDKLVLTCYRYDPASRKYQPFALGFVRAGGVLAAVGLGGLIAGLLWRERKKARQTA
ncbi:MAG: SCO family protein [Bacteroidetes bacterium]|nr:SCO family protein [Bacteroidota bacterium]MBL0276398.1 SCO family protein [Anaeromyxobacter sp.]